MTPEDVAARILSEGDRFFDMFPEVVTAAHAYAERQRTPLLKGHALKDHGRFVVEGWEK